MIEVVTNVTHTHPVYAHGAGTSWDIEENGALVVFGGDVSIGSYAPGAWSSVREVKDEPIEIGDDWDYDAIIDLAKTNPGFRAGLLVAARVAHVQGDGTCPSGMVAVYLRRLADGQQP